MKKLLLVLVSLFCLILAAGCGNDNNKAATATDSSKVLRVATSPASPPFELYLKERNAFIGFDIDLINGLAKNMGYEKVEFVNTEFEQLLPGLKEKKYDIAMHNFSRTKAREAEYTASDAYAKAGFSIVAKAGRGLKADKADSMNGMKVAIKANTSSERVAKSFPGAIIVEYPEYASALHAVTTGEADFAIAGNLTAAYYMTHTSNHQLEVIGHSLRQDDLVIYANKDNQALVDKFNNSLHDYKKSGEYMKLIHFYFGEIEKQEDVQ